MHITTDADGYVESTPSVCASFSSQINISSIEDLESFHEQIMGVPVLLRVWAEFVQNDYIGAAQPDIHFEGIPYPKSSLFSSSALVMISMGETKKCR